MSDYISRNNVIDVLKETGIIQDNDLGHLVVDEINRIPTLDEKEIIRKPFERTVERLEGELKWTRAEQSIECTRHNGYGSPLQSKNSGKIEALKKTIEIVKEECGINE